MILRQGRNLTTTGGRQMIGKHLKGFQFVDGILLAALLFVGGFHEYISCILSAAMVFWLILRLANGKDIRIQKGVYLWTVATVCLGYGVTCLWAVDRGMAFVGFLKFLPVGLYAICLWQTEDEGKVLQLLPCFGIFSVVVSAIGRQFSGLAGYFSVDSRLAGFFQYPNTFAMFLLICQLLVLKKERKHVWDYFALLILTGGIFYSGSRVVLIVFLLANVAMLLVYLPKKGRLPLILLLCGLLLVGFLLALDKNSVLNRYQIVSLFKTSLIDRLLYIFDSLPLLLKYPFGMGYMGYYYVQSSVQTGVYATTYVHNDFLQVFLDIGWIPGILLIWAMIRWFIRKDVSSGDKVIVGALCFHSLLDFDLQYTAMAMLLLLLINRSSDKNLIKLKDTFFTRTTLSATMTVTLYMAAALLLSHAGQYALADTLYPFNTRNMLTMLEQAKDMGQANELADRILRQNEDYYAPYGVKAKYCYSRGDFNGLIQYKNKGFEANVFGYSQYREYCQMLINGIAYYQQAGDWESVKICQDELLAAQARLAGNAERLSFLGKRLNTQPVTLLSEDLRNYIAEIGGHSQ